MKFIVALMKSIVNVIHNIAAILLSIASVLVFYQVMTRFVFNYSAAWSEVLARTIIIWTVFLVFGAAVYHGKIIRIDAVRNILPNHIQLWIMRTASLVTLIVLGVLIWYGIKMTIHVSSQNVAMLNISASYLYMALPIGSILAIPGVMLTLLETEKAYLNDDKKE